jgi:hypothetical protein
MQKELLGTEVHFAVHTIEARMEKYEHIIRCTACGVTSAILLHDNYTAVNNEGRTFQKVLDGCRLLA